jgi:hypothetical protein
MACFDAWDIGACGCTATCSTTIGGNVSGCGGAALGGATITAHDATSTGTVLGTATSVSSGGAYTVSCTGAIPGNAIVLVVSFPPRCTSVNRTLSYTAGTPNSTQWSCAKTTPNATTNLTPASGYNCGPCVAPIKNTVALTDSILGNVNLTWVSANLWTGSVSWTGGFCTCASSTQSIIVQWNGSSVSYQWKTISSGNFCPSASGNNQPSFSITVSSTTCPPSAFAFSGSKSIGACTGTSNPEADFLGPSQTWSVVASEL